MSIFVSFDIDTNINLKKHERKSGILMSLYKQSNYLNIIKAEDVEEIICYNSLFGAGNIHLLYDKEYIEALKTFSEARTNKRYDDRIIDDLVAANLLAKDEFINKENERIKSKNRISKWIKSLTNKNIIKNLNLSISEECNFICPHCSRYYTKELRRTENNNKMMSFDIAKKAIDYYIQEICVPQSQTPNIHFGADEPLLNYNVLKKTITYIKKIDPSSELSLNTNLVLLNKERAMFLKENDVEICSSLDGFKEGNNKVRKYGNNKGTFDDIVLKINLLKEIGYPLKGVITTIFDENWESINFEFIDWLNDMGFETVAIDVDLVNNMAHDKDECVTKLFELYKYINSSGLICGGLWLNPYELLLNGSETIPAYCKGIKGLGISVSYNGDIFLCTGSRKKLGHLDDIEGIFENNSDFINYIKVLLNTDNTDCEGCMIEGVCRNLCLMTAEFTQETNNNRKEEICYIHKKLTKLLLKDKLKRETT